MGVEERGEKSRDGERDGGGERDRDGVQVERGSGKRDGETVMEKERKEVEIER